MLPQEPTAVGARNSALSTTLAVGALWQLVPRKYWIVRIQLMLSLLSIGTQLCVTMSGNERHCKRAGSVAAGGAAVQRNKIRAAVHACPLVPW